MAQSSKQKKAAASARRKQKKAMAGGSPNQKKLQQLSEQNAQLQMSLLNIRQMYDQKVIEVKTFTDAITVKDQLLTAIFQDADGDFSLSRESVEAVMAGEVIGYEVDETEEAFVFSIITELDEDEDE